MQVPDSRINQGDWDKIEDAAGSVPVDVMAVEKISGEDLLRYIVKWDASKGYNERTETQKAEGSKWWVQPPNKLDVCEYCSVYYAGVSNSGRGNI